MKLLEMNHIRKSFGDTEVLKDISFSVEEGEVISIIGPSGSGKSTLLRCATLLEQMDGGELIYLGEKAAWNDANGHSVYAKQGDLKKIQQYFSLVFQNFNLFPHYSVLKNIMDAPICVQKRNKDEVQKEAEALLAKMGLEHRGTAYPCELSGGQQQRVSIARALAGKPDILVLDDTSSALDYRTDAALRQALRREMAGVTQVIVAQRVSSLRHADLILVLEEGRVIGRGNHQSLLQTCPVYREIAETQMGTEGGEPAWKTDPAS